jgi:hypothetical protein
MPIPGLEMLVIKTRDTPTTPSGLLAALQTV